MMPRLPRNPHNPVGKIVPYDSYVDFAA